MHRTDQVKTAAARLGVMLLYILPSLTEQRQPLDRAAFVVLKAQAKRLFHARFHVNLYGRRTKQETVAEMITAWSLLDGSEVEPVWDIYTQ